MRDGCKKCSMAHKTRRIRGLYSYFRQIWKCEHDLAEFWIGVALHTIQDSFSPAHVKRDAANDFKNITNICTYGDQGPGILDIPTCHHATIDLEDVVFQTPGGPLRPEAEAAVLASQDYLERMQAIMKMDKEIFSQAPHDGTYLNWLSNYRQSREITILSTMNGFFHQASGPGSGMFVCPTNWVARWVSSPRQWGDRVLSITKEELSKITLPSDGWILYRSLATTTVWNQKILSFRSGQYMKNR